MSNRMYQYGGNWFVTAPDGTHLALNTREGAETVLGLWEEIGSLDARLHKRSKRRRKGTPQEVLEQV